MGAPIAIPSEFAHSRFPQTTGGTPQLPAILVSPQTRQSHQNQEIHYSKDFINSPNFLVNRPGSHSQGPVQNWESHLPRDPNTVKEVSRNAQVSQLETFTGSPCRTSIKHPPVPLNHNIRDRALADGRQKQPNNKTYGIIQAKLDAMPLLGRRKKKEAPPCLFQQDISPQFSRVPSFVFPQPSPMNPGAFIDAASPAYPQVVYVPGLPKNSSMGFQQYHMLQPSGAYSQMSPKYGSNDADSPTRLKEFQTMQQRLNELIAQEKGSLSPGSGLNTGPLVTGKQPRRRRRRGDQGKEQKRGRSDAHDTTESSSNQVSDDNKLHVCSDCDTIRSNLFQELHGSTERRNFCTECQIKRLQQHKEDPTQPVEHFCFQCGQVRTQGFLQANPERKFVANLCEECIVYVKSRQHVPETSIVSHDGNEQRVSCVLFKPSRPCGLRRKFEQLTEKKNSRPRLLPWVPNSTSVAELKLGPSLMMHFALNLPSLEAEHLSVIRDCSVTATGRLN